MTQDNTNPVAGTTEPTEPEADGAQGSRKERVLHTRVPAVLELELKRLAQSWRVPVSNVVRAILEDAVATVEHVGHRAEGGVHRVVDRLAEQRAKLRSMREDQPPTTDGEAPGRSPSGGAQGVRADVLDGLIGFQGLRLATTATCSKCGREMRSGEEAFLGVRDGTGPRVLIGAECVPQTENNDHNGDEP